jgi:membrane associated rhomboid family serine protease
LIGAERVFPIRDLNPTRITPVLTLLVIVANVVVFFLFQPMTPREGVTFSLQHAAIACELTTGEPLTSAEFLSGRCETASRGAPIFPEKRLALSVLVSLFLHGGLLHLLGNMWFLWVFGNNVEEAFGHVGYALLYLVGGVAATLAFVVAHPAATDPLVGASGAIAAVLGAYLVLYPGHLVLSVVFITLIPVPAALFLGIWFLGQFAVADPGVAWEAHVGGFVVGVLVALVLRQLLLARVRRLHGPAYAD